MNRLLNTKIIILAILIIIVASGCIVSAAQSYTPLALPTTGSVSFRISSLGTLFIDFFRYTIALSAALAVFMLILGGVQYMSTDSWTGHHDGIERIKQALTGLLLVILTYLILQTINPNIVDISLLNKFTTNGAITTSSGSNPGGVTPGTVCSYAVESCWITDQNPGKVCATIVATEGKKYECSKDIRIDQGSPACKKMRDYWPYQKVTAGGCYLSSQKGKMCVNVHMGQYTVHTDCSKDIPDDAVDQNSSECKNLQARVKNQGYNPGGCYANVAQQGYAGNQGKFCVVYKKNGVDAFDCSGNLYDAFNQNTGACIALRGAYDNKTLNVTDCFANADTVKTDPGKKICVDIGLYGNRYKRACESIGDKEIESVCNEYKGYWNFKSDCE